MDPAFQPSGRDQSMVVGGAKLEYDYAKYIGKKNIIFNDSLDNYKDNVKIVAVMMRWMMDED